MSNIGRLGEKLRQRGYEDFLITAILGHLNTEHTAGKMLSYLNRCPSLRQEDLIDEMIAILEGRETYVKKQIVSRRKTVMDDLMIRAFSINWEHDISDDYVRSIPAIRNTDGLSFDSNITFFVGENGSGKSTLLEALAIAYGFNPEGGTLNYRFSTYDDYSGLGRAIRLSKGTVKPKWGYFLRAESFYNVASAAMREYNYDGRMTNYHARSHGESFLEFIQEAKSPGIYLMDEPEAALSAQRQLTLLIHLVKMAKQGSQFIIATHSPILLGIPDADILSFDEGSIHSVRYEDTDSYQITKLFIENREALLSRLLTQDETG